MLLVLGTLLLATACGGDDDNGGPSPEEKQLTSITKTWALKRATQGLDRTEEFTDFTLTFSGTYNAAKPKGPYTYTTAGTTPTPSPWRKGTGVWSFGDDATTTIVRDDGIAIKYVAEGDNLTLTLTCASCNATNGRPSSAEGDWTFVFTAAK